MTQNSAQKGIYPGWWIVVASFFLMAVIFTAAINLPGLWATYVAEDFGIQRSAFTAHITISTLSSMVAALFVGKLFQKYNVKVLMLIFAALAFAGFMGYSFATRIWQFYVISVVVGFCFMFLTSVPISILITNWFGPKMKGKAMGIAMTGSGVGAMILSPVVMHINSTYSWRVSYRMYAVMVLVIIIPLILFAVVKSPADKGVARIGDDPNTAQASKDAAFGLSAKQALSSYLFWLMFFTFFLFAMTTTLFNINVAPYMTDIGINPMNIGAYVSISSLGVIVGKLALGAIGDKWSARVGATSAVCSMILALVLLLCLPNMLFLAPAATLFFGLGNANATVNMPLITSDMVGNRDFGAIFGYASVASSLGAGVGPIVGSLIFDFTGSYAGAWGSDIALMALMGVGVHVCYKLKPAVHAKIAV
ncbi:MAG: MFS transporter [Clostridiales Family XIII bacterium]|nr:MFS transporter [Clostridiales Family XIII bacterium]